MNWLDIVLLLILAWSIAASFRKGLTREVLGLASVVLAFLLALWFYGTAGSYLKPYVSSGSLANLAGFLVVFAGVMLLGSLASFVLGKFLRVTGLSIVDHALGAVFGALRGTLIATVLIMAMMAFSPGDRPPGSVVRSRLAPYVAEASRVLVGIAPHELKEGFRKTYAQAKAAWGKMIDNGLRSAPKAQKENDERKL
jgi:membrane protein required for colicin V production